MFSPLPDNVPLLAAAPVIRDALEGTALIAAPAGRESAR
jgi:hypothetical protein